MNVLLTINYILLLKNIEYVSSQRRLTDPKPLNESKTYMVYLAQKQVKASRDWICGGVIIHVQFVLTSAACMEDAKKIYVVAGYKKYAYDLRRDKCAMAKMKRVVYTYVPKNYQLGKKLSRWTNSDIGIAEVESPFDFTDMSYTTMCSYIPTKIPVNLDPTKEVVGTPAIILGWGHSEYLDSKGRYYPNAEVLQYTSTWIVNKTSCVESLKKPKMAPYIERNMICTESEIPIDEYEGSVAQNDTEQVDAQNDTEQVNNVTRRGGLCQNDHGGPLVVWINGVETVIGVASMFFLGDNLECLEPSLFTSTAAFRRLISCCLSNELRKCIKSARRQDGYEIVQTAVDWSDETEETE